MAGEPNLGQGLETIPSLTAIWFSHYKRLITPILSNHYEMTKEISQYEDHLSRSFSSKPQKLLKKSYKRVSFAEKNIPLKARIESQPYWDRRTFYTKVL